MQKDIEVHRDTHRPNKEAELRQVLSKQLVCWLLLQQEHHRDVNTYKLGDLGCFCETRELNDA